MYNYYLDDLERAMNNLDASASWVDEVAQALDAQNSIGNYRKVGPTIQEIVDMISHLRDLLGLTE